MSAVRPSVYRDALTISPERIAAMTDTELSHLMDHLLLAHAYRCGSPRNEIRVNTEEKAKDDGCDGWSATPSTADSWFGSANTCWQLKAGVAGEPSRLKGEVTKAIPKNTLSAGGRLVVIAAGCTNGKKGEEDRKAVLVAEATDASLPTDHIDVIGSDRLARWCNEHPAVAAYWAGRPSGIWTLDRWANVDRHKDPWHGSPALVDAITQQRTALDIVAGSILHLHIQGPPGVGKTRFALELCRDAPWSGEVVYLPQATDERLQELIDTAAMERAVQMVVVADEAQANQLAALRDSVEAGNGRIRIITIGSAHSPDPARIPALPLAPLDDPAMKEVVSGFSPGMPREQVDFVVRFADGYVRLALLAAHAVAQNPAMDVKGLLSRGEIRQVLDKILGDGDRTALYVVAALTSVGWSEDKAEEGKAIAIHFGMSWNQVRTTVEQFEGKVGIAPRSGRYRYISPTPLGNFLAMEAWTSLPDVMKSLPEVLPSEEALTAYYERIRLIASNPKARDFAREQLDFFFNIDDFIDETAVRCWSALSATDPLLAARNVLRALTSATKEKRLTIEGRARRELIWTLVRIAWNRSSFRDSVLSLALLAEAENETWANNATGEFLERFQIFLGGTAAPYSQRLEALDELLQMERPSLTRLVIRALGVAARSMASRTDSGYPSDQVPETEWRLDGAEEYRQCIEGAIRRLIAIAGKGVLEVKDELIGVAGAFSMMLRQSEARALVVDLFDAIRVSYPDAREPLRRLIHRIVDNEANYWKQLAAADVAELEALDKRYEGSGLRARLQQLLVNDSWLEKPVADLEPIASELLFNLDNLRTNWEWLTSGDASDAWRLGVVLEGQDEAGKLADLLPELSKDGKDLRLACAYICNRRQRLGDQWYDEWIAKQSRRADADVSLLFELSWRCAVTEVLALTIAKSLREVDVAVRVVAPIGFGKWGENLDAHAVEDVLTAMLAGGHQETAIQLLAHRLESHIDETAYWESISLELVTTSVLIRSNQMTAFYWKKVASTLLPKHAGTIAAAIFREQDDRTSGIWFLEHSEILEVLNVCIERDANAVWEALKPHIGSPSSVLRFTIGFPAGVVDRMPADDVAAWIAEDPEQRASTIARLASKDLTDDQSLSARLLGKYGDNQLVASAFTGAYISGSWWGTASSHYATLAHNLAEVAAKTKLPKLRSWANDSARSLLEMAQASLQREQEGEIGRR